MRRRLSCEVVANENQGVAEALRRSPDRWLPEPMAPYGANHWRIYLWARDVGVLVDCGVGPPVTSGATTTRALTWEPRRSRNDPLWTRAMPRFTGRIAADGDQETGALRLVGWYEPPGGLLGAVADRVIMRHVAEHTARRFVADVARRLTADASNAV